MTSVVAGWMTTTIAECCDILDNKRKPINSSERLILQGHIPYYGANGIVGYINDFIFDEDLILIAEDGGNFGDFQTRPIAYKISGKSWVNNHAHVLRSRSSYCQDFIFYSLEHKDITTVLNGGTRAKLNKSELEKIEVFAPEKIAEQQKIAVILTAVDDKLDLIARQISATQTLKQGLMQTLFTRGAGTPDAQGRWHPHTAFQDTELGRIPVGWSVTTLGQVANVERGKFSARPRNDPRYFEAGNIPFIQTGDIAGATRYVSKSSQFLNEDGLFVSRLFPVGTIFITIAANIGDVAMAKIPMACPDSLVGILPNTATCDGMWLYYLLKSSKEYFDSQSTQNAQKNINLQVLRPYTFGLPPLTEQTQISGYLSSVDDKLATLTTKQTHYQSLKRGLMQKLLTGQWRVRVKSEVA